MRQVTRHYHLPPVQGWTFILDEVHILWWVQMQAMWGERGYLRAWWHLVILLLKSCNATAEQLENMVTLGGIHHQWSWWGLELIWPITSTHFLCFKSSSKFSRVLWLFHNWENKAFDPVRAGSRGKQNPRKPWHINCTVLFDNYDTAPTASLLLLQYSQVHRDSQNTGGGRKEPVCTQEKYHFTGIKRRYGLRTVMKIEPYVL